MVVWSHALNDMEMGILSITMATCYKSDKRRLNLARTWLRPPLERSLKAPRIVEKQGAVTTQSQSTNYFLSYTNLVFL